MFNQAIARQALTKHLSSDNDPLFRFRHWRANLRVLELEEIKSVAFVPCSQPFIERLIGTMHREHLDHVMFRNRSDLLRKLGRLTTYYNAARVHSALVVKTLAELRGRPSTRTANLQQFSWQAHCHGLFHTAIAA
jgi:putative transposase